MTRRRSSTSRHHRFYGALFDHVLSRMDAERVHRRSLGALRGLTAVPGVGRTARRLTSAKGMEQEIFGRTIRSPLGLAAGFDKNGTGIDALASLGFGFVEIGTVTGQPQPGNDAPRLFRLPADRGIVNRMGFNNVGSEAVAETLRRRSLKARRSDVMLGINIGKTKAVDPSDAIADYCLSAERLAPYADYLVVNVSSPNTPGLRDLQAVEQLRPLLNAVADTADEAADRAVPLLVKIAPDLADDDIKAVAELVGELNLEGVVATNTTISRDGLVSDLGEISACGAGGFSGPALRERALAVTRLLADELEDHRVIIGVGGISNTRDAMERLNAGANLVQAYTALIYGGPTWGRGGNRSLAGAHLKGRW